MRTRTGTWVLGCVGVVAAITLGACSFPDVEFLAEGVTTSASSASGGPGSGGGPSGTQSASGSGGDGGGGTGGAAGGSATSSGSGGAGGAGGCPDADGDGHTADYCGGDDCADGDDRAFTGQELYFSTPVKNLPPEAVLKYDFNCDGGEEVHYTSSVCKWGACDTAEHFLVDTEMYCGQTAKFGTCESEPLSCTEVVKYVSKAQECR